MPEPIRLPLVLFGNRRAYRDGAITAFLKEEPGTGTKDLTSRYIYEVERSAGGHLVELHRPANLNNGMDFTVRCPSIIFNNLNRLWRHVPKHDDLVAVLNSIRIKYPNRYPRVRASLQAAYACEDLCDLSSLSDMVADPLGSSAVGCPVDLAILVSRWLFVEQDVTYWHNSGRAMLFAKLANEELV